jgi:tetraacyldisaccharide 4'-kinase
MWLRRNPRSWALWPVSQVYRALIALRAALYKIGVLRSQHPGKPVIVVGNVVAGGSGKTPVVMALVRYLQSQGLRPGVISRGYGRTTTDCRAVQPHAVASEVGDEPLLIATQCQVPVYVARQRIEAARALLAQHPDTNVLVCDDGLQHLALARDIDICIFNAQGTGNGFLLPAGPLREPWPRPVDWVLYAGDTPPPPAAPGGKEGRARAPAFAVHRRLADHAVAADGTAVALSTLRECPLHAVAAIGQPGAFFAMLEEAGLTLAQAEALPDHYDFDSWSRLSCNAEVLICTEKDAVKLWKKYPDALAVPLELSLDARFLQGLKDQLLALAAPLSSTTPPAR